jgi:hypothetical protein
VSIKVFPLRGGESMPKGRKRLPEKSGKKEEQDRLAKVVSLAPLLKLALEFLELILRIFKVIN